MGRRRQITILDYTKIVEKAIAKQDYSEDVKDFTPEQKIELNLKIVEVAKAESAKELGIIEARRAEIKRLNEKPLEPAKDDRAVVEKFQKEQETEATNEFFNNPDFKIPDDLKASFDDTYKALKKGEVSKTQITQVLRRAYAATMGDNLIESHRKVEEMKKGAAGFNAGSANVHVNISPDDQNKFSRGAQDLYSRWQQAGYVGKAYTLERAEQTIKGGLTRTL